MTGNEHTAPRMMEDLWYKNSMNYSLDLEIFTEDLLAEEEHYAPHSGIHKMALESYGYRWFRVGDLNYVIHRERA
jgi:hypothetical protein